MFHKTGDRSKMAIMFNAVSFSRKVLAIFQNEIRQCTSRDGVRDSREAASYVQLNLLL